MTNRTPGPDATKPHGTQAASGDMNTNEVRNEVPEVPTALSTSFTSNTVHLAKSQNGHTFAACNGRTSFSGGMAPATEVTCKRCRKMVTL